MKKTHPMIPIPTRSTRLPIPRRRAKRPPTLEDKLHNAIKGCIKTFNTDQGEGSEKDKALKKSVLTLLASERRLTHLRTCLVKSIEKQTKEDGTFFWFFRANSRLRYRLNTLLQEERFSELRLVIHDQTQDGHLMARLNQDVRQLKLDNVKLLNDKTALNNSITKLNNRITELEKDKATLQTAHDKLLEENTLLRERQGLSLDHTISEHEELYIKECRKSRDLETTLEEKEKSIKSLSKDLEACKSEIQLLRARLKQAQELGEKRTPNTSPLRQSSMKREVRGAFQSSGRESVTTPSCDNISLGR